MTYLTEDYWNKYYDKYGSTLDPSSFAEDTFEKCRELNWVIELGAGNARDSVWFVRNGKNVYASDGSAVAVNVFNSNNEILQNSISFQKVDYSNDREINEWIRNFPGELSKALVYGRFLLHAIDESTELIIWKNLLELFRIGLATAYFEFRTVEDTKLEKVAPEHFRRYIELKSLDERLSLFDLRITSSTQGVNLAIFGSENPHLARISVGMIK